MDKERNDKIIEAIAEAAERSALVFATSVQHARRLAAHLNLLDIPAAVVSGETDRSSRRWFIKAFQAGEVCALCNHVTDASSCQEQIQNDRQRWARLPGAADDLDGTTKAAGNPFTGGGAKSTGLVEVVDIITFDRTDISRTGVPEPAAWVTMIVGLGVAGALIRRGRLRGASLLG